MTIKTKFNVGDEVWLMENNKPKNYEVFDIEVKVFTNHFNVVLTRESYCLAKNSRHWELADALFATKEELLRSL